ncbi:uncharacterized protein LOC129255643 [Lytechinus pictus]|uniref:uncharacterized protein LOC129255643 n=2 Tax=Lytechinus pictus TaxID=7653 RepID=UPI0030B9CB60
MRLLLGAEHKFLQNFECQIDKKCRRNCCCFEFNFTSPVKYTFPVLLVEAAAAKDDANLHDVASGVLSRLQSLFKEGNDSLFLIRDVTDTAEDMEKEGDASDSPKLIIQGDPFDSAKSQWMVMVESRVIGHSSSTTEGFLCGVAYLFATYYNLNLEYPSTAAATLEFIQRCLLGISPDGSKCHASKSHCNAKVVSFVRRFADFQWL